MEHSSVVQTPMEHSDDGTNTEHSDTEAVALEVGDTAGEVHDVDHNVSKAGLQVL